MKRSGFLKKLLLFIVATVLLNAILTLAFYVYQPQSVCQHEAMKCAKAL